MSETNAAFETRSRPVLEDLLAGLTEGEAGAKHGVSERTVQRWLARGRKDPSSLYGEFATVVDRARLERELPPNDERPLDEAELLVSVYGPPHGGWEGLKRGVFASLALAAALVTPAGAGAATQIGQLAPPTGTCGTNLTVIQSSSPNNEYAAPFGGVITSWSYYAGSPAGTGIELKVARPAGGNNFSIVGESPPHNPTASTVNTYTDVRIPVEAGDVIGYYNVNGVLCFAGPVGGFGYHSIVGDQPPGPTALPFTPSGGGPITFAAILEPDIDNDGFGDENQDACPADASLHDAPCDRVAPETQITKGPNDKTKKKQATFEFTGNEQGATFECSLDGATFAPCTSPHTVKVKKGKHSFEVRAVDQAGNVGSPATDDWKFKKKKRKK